MVSHTSNGLCPVLNKNEEKRKEKGAHTFVSARASNGGYIWHWRATFFEDLLLVQFM